MLQHLPSYIAIQSARAGNIESPFSCLPEGRHWLDIVPSRKHFLRLGCLLHKDGWTREHIRNGCSPHLGATAAPAPGLCRLLLLPETTSAFCALHLHACLPNKRARRPSRLASSVSSAAQRNAGDPVNSCVLTIQHFAKTTAVYERGVCFWSRTTSTRVPSACVC